MLFTGTDITSIPSCLLTARPRPRLLCPWHFSWLLRDEFTSIPLLPRTCRQLSESFLEPTVSLQRIFILTC